MSMAERTLRERCIEAGAEALSAVSPAFNDREDAVVAVFDAILGVLTEHADEWFDAWASREDPAFTGLLAVLEGDE